MWLPLTEEQFEETRPALQRQIAEDPGIDADSIEFTVSTPPVPNGGGRRRLLQAPPGVVVVVSFRGSSGVSLERVIRLNNGALLEQDGVVKGSVDAARKQYEAQVLGDKIASTPSESSTSNAQWIILGVVVGAVVVGGGVYWGYRTYMHTNPPPHSGSNGAPSVKTGGTYQILQCRCCSGQPVHVNSWHPAELHPLPPQVPWAPMRETLEVRGEYPRYV